MQQFHGRGQLSVGNLSSISCHGQDPARLAEHSRVLRPLRRSCSITGSHSVIFQNRCHWACAVRNDQAGVRSSSISTARSGGRASRMALADNGVQSDDSEPAAPEDRVFRVIRVRVTESFTYLIARRLGHHSRRPRITRSRRHVTSARVFCPPSPPANAVPDLPPRSGGQGHCVWGEGKLRPPEHTNPEMQQACQSVDCAFHCLATVATSSAGFVSCATFCPNDTSGDATCRYKIQVWKE